MIEKHKQRRIGPRAYVYCGYLNRNNYIRCLSHNLYSDYLAGKHKIAAPRHDPDDLVLVICIIGIIALPFIAALT